MFAPATQPGLVVTFSRDLKVSELCELGESLERAGHEHDVTFAPMYHGDFRCRAMQAMHPDAYDRVVAFARQRGLLTTGT